MRSTRSVLGVVRMEDTEAALSKDIRVVSPSIILRFRDAIDGIDRINEHHKWRDKEGAVWWGWWKKQFEDDQREVFDSLNGKSFYVLLADPSTNRFYIARCLRSVLGPGASIDEARVPEYYRHNIPLISAWFLLDSVEDYPISAEVHKLSHAHREYSTAVRCSGHLFTDSCSKSDKTNKLEFFTTFIEGVWMLRHCLTLRSSLECI